jgi:hypothetical protein
MGAFERFATLERANVMRKEIRERLENNGMEQNNITMSKEQFQELLTALANPRMNPLEQKKYDEEAKRDKRRAALAIELGRSEAENRWRRQNSCSHSRDSRTGQAVTRGSGEWTTGGQVHGDDTISLGCLRCGTVWHWKGSPQERDYALNAGLLGFAPPPVERCLNKEDFAPPVAPSQETMDKLSA